MRPYPFISRIRCTRLSDYFAYPLYKTIRLFRVSVVQDYPIISRIRCTRLSDYFAYPLYLSVELKIDKYPVFGNAPSIQKTYV